MRPRILETGDCSKIQFLLEYSCKFSGISSAFLDLNGNFLASSPCKKLCRKFHMSNAETSARCLRKRNTPTAKYTLDNEYTIHTCPNGLVDIGIPVGFNENNCLNLFAGQLFIENPDVDFFRKQAKKFGFNEGEYLEALKQIPVLSRDQFNDYLNHLLLLSRHLVELSGQKKQYHERVKELNCLYGLSEIIEKPHISLDDIFREAAELMRSAWQYPDIACIRIRFNGREYKTVNFKEAGSKQTADIMINGEAAGILEVRYLKKKPVMDEGPFLVEERKLLDTIAKRLAKVGERKLSEEKLKNIEWLFSKRSMPESGKRGVPFYGDLTTLNTSRIILDSVGKQSLENIATDIMELLDSSIAVYEKNGDYAFGMLVSGWCRMLDAASRKLCKTDDNKEALTCGKWLCHENCWNDSARSAIESGVPTDIRCVGGIRLYAVPIRAGKKIIGAVNIGYGNPPSDPEKINRLAKTFGVSKTDLERQAETYKVRPDFIIEASKHRARTAAQLIGEIVERKRIEKELAAEKDYLMVTLTSISDGVIVSDREGRITFMNPAAEKLTGWSQQEAHNLPVNKIFTIINQHSRRPLENPVRKTIKHNRVMGLADHTVLISKDDTERIIADSCAPIPDENARVRGAVLVFRDETQKEEMEKHLRHSQKMETVGTLAGGTAHEFNNIIGGILGYTEVAKEIAAEDSPLQNNLDQILQLSNRAIDIVKQLLVFSRKSPVSKSPLQLNVLLKEQIQMLRNIIPSNIAIRTTIDENTYTVTADSTQMQQVFLNLCSNAVHAMEENGGILEITLSPVYLNKTDVKTFQSIQPGKYVQIIVSDTGSGIAPEIIGRIFEPFFTTKETNKGTGMGLSVVHAIIQDHGGAIAVSSEIGKGTFFTVVLPLTENKTAIETKQKEEEIPEGNEHILIVDDEEVIVFPTKVILERLGYRVTAMTSSLEALKQFRKNPDEYDLIITDLTMPGLTGDRLTTEVINIRPEIPVILMTGYNDMIDSARIKRTAIKAFIPKPFKKPELAKTIRLLLDGD